jgi:hypothetical protein
MANIPVIPGVSVTTKSIFNKPLKDIICALLFGGINNMIRAPLLCINFDLNKIAEEAGLAGLGDLKAELDNIQDQLKAAEALAGIPETLGRVNAAIAEVQSLLSLDGVCAIPLKAPKIPDVISQVIDAEFRELNAILNDLGRLARPNICLELNGGLNVSSGYNPDSILGSLSRHVGRMGDIPGNQLDALVKRLKGVRKALDKSINRQLFPDFRHKHDLTTGKPYVAGGGPTVAAAPPLANQWNPPYPPPDAPNLKSATATAQTLVASVKQTGSYPVKVDGITNANLWLPMLGPEVYSLAVNALTPQDPFFAQEEPVYDYCGKLVGYTSTVISGVPESIGGDPTADAVLEPVQTTFEFLWIPDRNCWAVTGKESEQLITVGRDAGRKGVYLNASPEIELRRGYAHTFSVPSIAFMGSEVAPEFFVCKVGTDLKPLKVNGRVVPFNQGLARLETYELLEDANGSFDTVYATERKGAFPTGTTLYFAAEQRVYSGETEPANPNEDTWWYNLVSCDTKRFVLNRDSNNEVVDGTGTWIEVSDADREAKWFGSSNVFGAPNADYLAYSNQDGSVFGLFKFI